MQALERGANGVLPARECLRAWVRARASVCVCAFQVAVAVRNGVLFVSLDRAEPVFVQPLLHCPLQPQHYVASGHIKGHPRSLSPPCDAISIELHISPSISV